MGTGCRAHRPTDPTGARGPGEASVLQSAGRAERAITPRTRILPIVIDGRAHARARTPRSIFAPVRAREARREPVDQSEHLFFGPIS